MQIDIEKLVYGGDGLARMDGQVVLTPFVLAEEKVAIAIEPKRSGILRGSPDEILSASPHRVTPPCLYFGRCGGCHYQHASYEAQLEIKRAILVETLTRTGKVESVPDVSVIAGEPWGYRNRIQLHFENRRVGYREARSHRLCAIQQCPISSPRLNDCITVLNRMVRDSRWPQFLKTAELFTNESDVQFNVTDTSRPIAQRFFDWCSEEIPGFVQGALQYDEFRVSYGSFFQVNRFLVRPLVEAAIGRARGDLALDLYAGVGLFSLPLADRFQQVEAVESGNGAIRDLEHNMAGREQGRVSVHASNVEDFLAGFDSVPDFVLADPPRTGLGKRVVSRLSELRAPQITIVACDPVTLARDAQMLIASGYRLDGLTLVDLFPQTYHLETIARFELT